MLKHIECIDTWAALISSMGFKCKKNKWLLKLTIYSDKNHDNFTRGLNSFLNACISKIGHRVIRTTTMTEQECLVEEYDDFVREGIGVYVPVHLISTYTHF